MAYVGSTNNLVTLGSADTLYAWKTALLAAGWRLLATSNGTTLVTVGLPGTDNLLSPANWTATGAWCRLKEPSPGTREFILMRGSTNLSALIKYSRSTGFTTAPAGGITATQCPTTGVGGDGVVWWGVGTDLTAYSATTPSAQNVGFALTSGYVSFVASDTAVNGVWGFWGFAYNAGTGATAAVFIHEAIAAASTPPGDNDPSWRQIAPYPWAYDGGASNLPQYWQGYGLSTAVYKTGSNGTNGWGRYVSFNSAFTPVGAGFPSSGASFNPYNGKVGMYPPMIGGTPGQLPKGFATGVNMSSIIAKMLDTYNLSTAEARLVCGTATGNTYIAITMPWVTGIVPLV